MDSFTKKLLLRVAARMESDAREAYAAAVKADPSKEDGVRRTRDRIIGDVSDLKDFAGKVTAIEQDAARFEFLMSGPGAVGMVGRTAAEAWAALHPGQPMSPNDFREALDSAIAAAKIGG